MQKFEAEQKMKYVSISTVMFLRRQALMPEVVRKNKYQLHFVYFCLSFIIKKRCVKFQGSTFIEKETKTKTK